VRLLMRRPAPSIGIHRAGCSSRGRAARNRVSAATSSTARRSSVAREPERRGSLRSGARALAVSGICFRRRRPHVAGADSVHRDAVLATSSARFLVRPAAVLARRRPTEGARTNACSEAMLTIRPNCSSHAGRARRTVERCVPKKKKKKCERDDRVSTFRPKLAIGAPCGCRRVGRARRRCRIRRSPCHHA